MAKSNDIKSIEKISTTLGRETVFKGTMKFSESLKIDGKFEGDIESTGFLYIEDGAVVKADIKVRAVVVGGIVRGNIEASDRLEMLTTGQVYGNIRTSKLRIADGVVFEGKCEMIKGESSVDIFSTGVQSLKETVKTV
ncbi:MAG: polymer-forming cytoskeletal protein [Spirochaetia bacterium]|jgi:cytoskeletal protein CcmA (bactofilin family)|nr:polymer-forming cytoskeletal protein [Spirochaetia bacterium]